MGKKLRTFLAAFVAALGLVILVFASHPSEAQAAEYKTNDLLSGISIKQKDYGTASDINLTLDWDAKDIELHNSDTWEIQFPDTLKVTRNGEIIPFYNDAGTLIGTGVLDANSNTLTVTFNEQIENQKDFKGSISILTGIGPGKGANIGNNNVVIGDFNDNMTIISSDADFSKKGVIGTDENGDAIITWTILANRNSAEMPNLKIIENNINDDQAFIKGSVNVYEASWTSPGYYKKGYQLNSSEYTYAEDGNGFIINGLPKDNQFYAVTFQTKINDPDNATNGHKFKNHADFTWGNGSSTGTNMAAADGSVTGNSNSGSGNGNNILGSVVLTKTSADENNTLISGATYSLYRKDANEDTLIQSDLVTDTNGQITVDKLPAGDYYFVETSTPDGYQQNPNEIPFTITGQTTTAVQVETKDEPVDSKEGSIIIQKLDAATGYRLAGAEFDVIDANTNEVIGHITTDQLGYGHMYNIPYGNYILRETKAPDGYILNNKDITFTISDETQAPAIISIDNEKETGGDGSFSASMIKYDADLLDIEKVGVAGAEYTLYDADGTKLGVFQTNDEGVIKVDNLNPGSYYFVETKAPDGYGINNEKIEFTITDSDIELGTLETSDPKLTDGNEGNETPGTDGNGNEGNTETPDTDGNGDGDNNGGVIVDPENPGSNNNNNGNEGGLITNPINPGNANNGSNNSSKLPQTGEKNSLTATFLGLVLLSGIVYFKRRNV
ncbi:LPXTG cell wall anchor domain-containing protein [Companilactobacillus futsaii]|uniref:LPXTG cell wall anchor domain-containing protein n=2 Tax=Companilactobacillus futsaii TaxID=938155 RepID=A0A5B7T690_9LACO|nr:LPXTG cell wall anchor domain-containing protein [Companilactobacillus futsaii]KRK93603.1 adhesion exoprotein [Companilactobacillus futsaii JCM 17355]QCX25940.1 LPXTG cell wall anchor domain-containing protein [Companilactobacillus futsaii]